MKDPLKHKFKLFMIDMLNQVTSKVATQQQIKLKIAQNIYKSQTL